LIDKCLISDVNLILNSQNVFLYLIKVVIKDTLTITLISV